MGGSHWLPGRASHSHAPLPCLTAGNPVLATLSSSLTRTLPLPSLQFKDAWYDTPAVGHKQEDVACSARDTGLFELAR